MHIVLKLAALVPLVGGVSAIVGESTEAQSAGFAVSVVSTGWFGERHICGGSIIGPRTVLTSAHCADGSSATSLKVKYGGVDQTSFKVTDQVTQIIKHPNWNTNTKDSDYAILRLANVVDFDGLGFKAAEIPEAPYPTTEPDSAHVVGWGRTSPDEGEAKVLHEANLTFLSASVCNDKWSDINPITSNMGCIESPNANLCTLDEGGPVTDSSMTTVHGVASWGDEGCNPDSTTRPYVFADVASARPWILSNNE